MRRLMLMLPLVLVPLGALADDVRVDRIDVVDRGIYVIEAGAQTKNAGTPTGEITAVTTARNVAATTTIPARVGVEFGFRFVVVGAPAGAKVALDMVDIYPAPGLRAPGSAEPMHRSRYRRTKTVGATEYVGYGFENPWELVPGTWTFQIWHGGRKLAEERFTVVKK